MASTRANTPGTIVPSFGKVPYRYTPAPSGECWKTGASQGPLDLGVKGPLRERFSGRIGLT
jgi:hypothetical protein